MRLGGLAERFRRRVVLERDLRRLRTANGSALQGAEGAAGPPVLIVSLTDFVYQLKLEGLLGKALQLAGRRPVVLVPSGSWIPRKYLEVFGVRDFVTLDEFVEGDAEAEAARILDANPSAADLKELSYRGAAIGRHVLSTLSRALHEGSVDPRQPEARAKLGELLPRTLATTIAAGRLLDELQPELVLFLERNYAADATDVSSRTGALSTKGQVLASVKDDKTVLEAADLSDLNVRKEGDTAVVTGINHVRGRDDKGQAFDRWYRFTDVFVKRDGRWQVLATQGTPIQ